MQFSKIVAILSFTAGTTLATPQYTHELSKRTCWELTGTALKICQEACTLACVRLPHHAQDRSEIGTNQTLATCRKLPPPVWPSQPVPQRATPLN